MLCLVWRWGRAVTERSFLEALTYLPRKEGGFLPPLVSLVLHLRVAPWQEWSCLGGWNPWALGFSGLSALWILPSLAAPWRCLGRHETNSSCPSLPPPQGFQILLSLVFMGPMICKATG